MSKSKRKNKKSTEYKVRLIRLIDRGRVDAKDVVNELLARYLIDIIPEKKIEQFWYDQYLPDLED